MNNSRKRRHGSEEPQHNPRLEKRRQPSLEEAEGAALLCMFASSAQSRHDSQSPTDVSRAAEESISKPQTQTHSKYHSQPFPACSPQPAELKCSQQPTLYHELGPSSNFMPATPHLNACTTVFALRKHGSLQSHLKQHPLESVGEMSTASDHNSHTNILTPLSMPLATTASTQPSYRSTS